MTPSGSVLPSNAASCWLISAVCPQVRKTQIRAEHDQSLGELAAPLAALEVVQDAAMPRGAGERGCDRIATISG